MKGEKKKKLRKIFMRNQKIEQTRSYDQTMAQLRNEEYDKSIEAKYQRWLKKERKKGN